MYPYIFYMWVFILLYIQMFIYIKCKPMLVTATKHQKLELVFPNSKTPHWTTRFLPVLYERIYFMFLFDNRGIFHQPLKNITATKATITSNTVRTMYIKHRAHDVHQESD